MCQAEAHKQSWCPRLCDEDLVSKWRTKCRSSACLCLSCCREKFLRRSQKEKHVYLSSKETFSFLASWIFLLKRREKKEQNFEIQNLLYHKIKIVLLWHYQNEPHWLHFGIFSNGFVLQNIQLELGRMFRISGFCQFCLPVFLFCYIYPTVKFLIQRPPKPKQGLALPPAHSKQVPSEKWNFLGCCSGLFSQDCIHTEGKTS